MTVLPSFFNSRWELTLSPVTISNIILAEIPRCSCTHTQTHTYTQHFLFFRWGFSTIMMCIQCNLDIKWLRWWYKRAYFSLCLPGGRTWCRSSEPVLHKTSEQEPARHPWWCHHKAPEDLWRDGEKISITRTSNRHTRITDNIKPYSLSICSISLRCSSLFSSSSRDEDLKDVEVKGRPEPTTSSPSMSWNNPEKKQSQMQHVPFFLADTTRVPTEESLRSKIVKSHKNSSISHQTLTVKVRANDFIVTKFFPKSTYLKQTESPLRYFLRISTEVKLMVDLWC